MCVSVCAHKTLTYTMLFVWRNDIIIICLCYFCVSRHLARDVKQIKTEAELTGLLTGDLAAVGNLLWSGRCPSTEAPSGKKARP